MGLEQSLVDDDTAAVRFDMPEGSVEAVVEKVLERLARSGWKPPGKSDTS